MPYRTWPAQLVALAVVGVLGLLSRLPEASDAERDRLAEPFRFTRQPLPGTDTPRTRTVLPVNPVAHQVARWLSSVGTSVSLGDLDENGVADDVCAVEPRTGEVVAGPAPGTGDRYSPFVLQTETPWDTEAIVPTGCKFGDFNEDGLADLMVHFIGRTPLLFLRRAPEAVAVAPVEPADTVVEHAITSPTLSPPTLAAYAAVPVMPADTPWWTSTVLQADVDGDGHLDLVVGNYFPDGQRIFGRDADGPVTMHDSFSRARNGGTNRVLRWMAGRSGAHPSATFEEQPNPFPNDDATGWTLALGAADLDQDGLSELYVANDFGPDALYLNRSTPGKIRLEPLHGRKGFAIPTSHVLGNDSFKGMGVDFGDVNGDGIFDLFVSNITVHGGLEEAHFLFVSDREAMGRLAEGVAPWDDRGEEYGVVRSSWAWDTRLADFDNDGRLEMMQATGFLKGETNWWADLAELANSHDSQVSDPRHWPNFPEGIDISGHDPEPFYTLGDDGQYIDISRPVGFDGDYNSRGLALADVDRDGDLDLALANQWEDSWFFRNDSHAGRSLGLALVLGDVEAPTVVAGAAPGAETRPAIGAFARITVDGQDQIRQVDGGNGHSGANAAELLFGVGEASGDIPVHVRWRDHTGTVREADLSLPAGWHTVTLPA